MKDTKRLYGKLDPLILETQKSIAQAKIKACNELLDQLLKAPLEARDWDRIKEIIEARTFNEEILKEVV